MDPPHFQICDLGSRNGTYLNGKKIGDNECWVIVEHGDMITLGGTTFRIAVIDQPDAADADSTDASAEKSGTQQDCLVAC
jgi:pSer/pThr/pTyr-binding forkhead associated (FHA) protein